MINDEELHKILRTACREYGGQTRLAERVGIKRQYITKVFNGEKPISDDIARALGYKRMWVKK